MVETTFSRSQQNQKKMKRKRKEENQPCHTRKKQGSNSSELEKSVNLRDFHAARNIYIKTKCE